MKDGNFGRPRSFDKDDALRIALNVFWRHGYEQTTMALLSEKMGIASASIYCAYGNKASLFLEALRYYQKTYWDPLYEQYTQAPDIYMATDHFFTQSAHILLAPNAPCGCLIVMGFLNLPENEPKLLNAIAERREHTRRMFRNKLKDAANQGIIRADCDIPGIAGALHNFFEGLSIQARGDLCLSELVAIAQKGVFLLPPPKNPHNVGKECSTKNPCLTITHPYPEI